MNSKAIFKILLIGTAFAFMVAVPRSFNYQGKLVDSFGIGVNDTLPITFRLYTSETGGMPLWERTIENVIVSQGLFSVELSGFPDSVDFSNQYWLEVEAAGEIFLPREKLVASPYSIRSREVENAIQGVNSRANLLLRRGVVRFEADSGATLTDSGDTITVRFLGTGGAAAPPVDFAVRVNQSSLSVYRGSSVANKVTVILLTPATTPHISFSVEGLPTGATGSFSPATCDPTCSSILTITTTNATPSGTYNIEVIATSATVARTATFTLTVNIPFDYTVSVDPVSSTIDQGSTTETQVSANLITGFPESVTFSVSGLPSGCVATFSPTSCILSCTSTLTINTSITTPPGSYPCQITVMTSGGVVRTTTFTLTINYYNFTLSLSQSAGTIDQGGSISPVTVTATNISEVPQMVNFSLLPSPMHEGINASLTTTSCTPTCYTVLNASASQTVTPGEYPIDIVATGVGGSSDTIRYNLTVNAFNFSISLNPLADTISIYGSPCNVSTVDVGLTRTSTTTQMVRLSASGVPTRVTAVFSPDSCLPNCNSTLTFTAEPDATTGLHNITISATAIGGTTRSSNFALVISGINSWTQTTTADFSANTNEFVSISDDKVSLPLSSWYDVSWTRRRPVTISNSGSLLTDFQVRVNVSYDSDMRSDFGDLRFTASDGTTLLNYWVESYVASSSAVVWVKVPSIPGGNSTIYMYYGNPTALSASNMNAVLDSVNYNFVYATGMNEFSSTSFTQIPGTSLTLTTSGNPVLLIANVDGQPITGDSWATFAIRRNGTNLSPTEWGHAISVMHAGWNIMHPMVWIDTPPAGTHTYDLAIRRGGSYNYQVEEANPSVLIAIELKSINYSWTYATGMNEFSSTSFTQIPGTQISITTSGYPVLLLANADGQSTGGDSWANLTIRRNGTNISPTVDGLSITCTHGGWNKMHPMIWIDNPPAGTHTYDLAIKRGGSYNYQIEEHNPSVIIAIELRGVNYKSVSTTGADTYSSTSWTDVVGASSSIATNGNPLLLLANMDTQPIDGGGDSWAMATIFRGTTQLSPTSYGLALIAHEHSGWNHMGPMFWVDPVSAGSYTYKLSVARGGSYNFMLEQHNPSFLGLIELRFAKYASPEPTATVGSEESCVGTTTTPVISPTYLCRWNTITYNTETPSGSSVTIDILDAGGSVLMSNVSSGADISSITASRIRLRARLTTTNPSSVPSLLDWTLSFYGVR